MTMRHISYWKRQSTSRGRWASERLLMEFVIHLGKKLLLPGLLDVMLYKLDMQDPQRNDCQTCLKVRWSFIIPASRKNRVCQTFCRTQKKVTDKLPIQEELSLKFLVPWKSLLDTMGLQAKMDTPMVQENFWETVQEIRGLCQFQSFVSCLQGTSCLLRYCYILLESLMELKNRQL